MAGQKISAESALPYFRQRCSELHDETILLRARGAELEQEKAAAEKRATELEQQLAEARREVELMRAQPVKGQPAQALTCVDPDSLP
ncbi:hypothetical protein [Streptomyces naphthomycinicus]|uniref:hypothetical protein n=1 Tax=Streptomyces naphthomycinicus TaxID=2872625 RepID=UPI001CEDB36C|nr:hypothetical protein [Streptomyces sp. TML10]